MTDLEGVARVFVAKQVVEIVARVYRSSPHVSNSPFSLATRDVAAKTFPRLMRHGRVPTFSRSRLQQHQEELVVPLTD